MFSYVLGLKAWLCCGKYHSMAWYIYLPSQVPRSKATTVALSSVPLATLWFGPTYSAVPVAGAWAPPHDDHTTCVTRPVGSPPLKILAGLTWPNPCPWAQSAASWPSVGTPAGLADGDAEAGTVAVPGETVGWLTAVALGVAATLGELLAAGGAEDEHPPASTARPASAIAAPARPAMRRAAAVVRFCIRSPPIRWRGYSAGISGSGGRTSRSHLRIVPAAQRRRNGRPWPVHSSSGCALQRRERLALSLGEVAGRGRVRAGQGWDQVDPGHMPRVLLAEAGGGGPLQLDLRVQAVPGQQVGTAGTAGLGGGRILVELGLRCGVGWRRGSQRGDDDVGDLVKLSGV